jgi:hypothetical protein
LEVPEFILVFPSLRAYAGLLLRRRWTQDVHVHPRQYSRQASVRIGGEVPVLRHGHEISYRFGILDIVFAKESEIVSEGERRREAEAREFIERTFGDKVHFGEPEDMARAGRTFLERFG